MLLGDRWLQGMWLCGFWRLGTWLWVAVFTPYVTRHRGVCTLLKQRFYESRKIMGYHIRMVLDSWGLGFVSRLCFLRVRRVSGVFGYCQLSQAEGHISQPLLSWRAAHESELEHRSSIFYLSSQSLLRLHFCSSLLSCSPQARTKLDGGVTTGIIIRQIVQKCILYHTYFSAVLGSGSQTVKT